MRTAEKWRLGIDEIDVSEIVDWDERWRFRIIKVAFGLYAAQHKVGQSWLFVTSGHHRVIQGSKSWATMLLQERIQYRGKLAPPSPPTGLYLGDVYQGPLDTLPQ